MPAAITVRMGDVLVDPVVAETAVHIHVDDLDVNALGESAPPAGREDGTPITYYIIADGPQDARDDGKSHRFQPSHEGKHVWDNYIFPTDGSYTIRVFDDFDDSEVVTEAVTVVAAS
jgi:hypothetical protein